MVYLAGGDREGGTRHNERRLLRFGFDDLKLRNFQNCLSKTKQRECPEGVLYTCFCCCIAICASYCVVPYGVMVRRLCYTYPAWGLCVARFDRQGNAKASDREASNSAGLHAFFMSC